LSRSADILLIDERRGRRIAAGLGLRVLGLLGLLAEAKHRGSLHDCKPVLDQLIMAGFWIGKDLYKKFLNEMDETIF
jgi:predicted nucleic acid-binding protein